MEIVRERSGAAQIIRLSGELGVAEAAALKECLEGALAGEGAVVLDMAEVDSLDVCCLQVLMAAGRPSAGRAALRVAATSAASREAVGLAGLEAGDWPAGQGGP